MKIIASIALFFALATFTLFLVLVPPQSEAEKEKSPIIAFSSSEQVFSETFLIKDVVTHFSNNVELFYILRGDGQVDVYNSHNKLKRKIPTHMKSPSSIAVDSKGRIYIADNSASQIRIFSSEGNIINTFFSHRPNSIAVLTNGNIVVASPFNGLLLHVYDSSGQQLRSFGEIKQFDSSSYAQNNFLNKGKVLVDLSNTIYYVYEFAPIQIIQRFSQKGKLISEFSVTGDAIDLQKDVASEFLRNRSSNKIGGISIITSAAIDQTTNRLWIGMNGSSDSGVVYEYKPNGKKLQEYKFLIDSVSNQWDTITSVRQLIVRSPFIYVFTRGGAFRFDFNSTPTAPPPFHIQTTCSVAVPFPDCTTPCGTTQGEDDKNCKQELVDSIDMNGRRIIEATCDVNSNDCYAEVKVCKESNGVVTSHDISLPCSGSECEFQVCDYPSVWDFQQCCCANGGVCDSPILVDVLGNGFDLTGASGGVNFDLNCNGIAERLAWTSANSDDAFLALDRDNNGMIDNGKELFGNLTPQPPSTEPNGFIALAEYDKPENGGNNDGKIDGRDAIFVSLRLWQDANHNGISEASELHTLPSLGLESMDLDYKKSKRRDQHGNWFRYRAKVRDTQGAQIGRWAWDVFLVTAP